MNPVPIVLLHGLGRTSRSMMRLARLLTAVGHETLVPGYASRRHDIEACARSLKSEVAAFRAQTGISPAFVTHSMGGLVARCLATNSTIGAAAIVMLAPPNGGSEIADVVIRFRLARAILGPALADLTSGAPARLPVPDCPIGVVAGSRSWLPFASRCIAGQHDNLVSFSRSRIDAPHDWIALPAEHTFLMNHPDVAVATAAFLRDRRFPNRFRGGDDRDF